MAETHVRAKAPERPFFRAALRQDGTLEIQIYEVIGEDWWTGGGVTGKAVADQIKAAGVYQKILLRINSPGGDVFEGIAIYNLVRAEKKPVEVRVDGIAASAASIIAMAGDEIIMGPNTMMSVHNAWTYCQGFASDMRTTADKLDKISGAIAQTYVTRTKQTLDAITALMEAETWMTAQECIDGGFATQIVTESDGVVEQAALAMARRFKSLGRMNKVPEKLKADATDDVCECPCQSCADGDCGSCTNVNCDDVNCDGCPMQASESNLSLFETRAKMLGRTTT